MAEVKLEKWKSIAYDPNTDYQAIINESVEKKDYKTAAEAERMRNAKIAGEALGERQTHNYDSPNNDAAVSAQNWAYDPNANYMAIMEECAKSGDKAGAAAAEKMRNAKIRGEGLNYQETHLYDGEDGGSGQTTGDPASSAESLKPPASSSRYGSVTSGMLSGAGSASGTAERYRQELEDALAARRKNELLEKYQSVLRESRERKNAAAAESALKARSFHEAAATSGLGSGSLRQNAAARAAQLKAYFDALDKSGTEA